MSTATGKKSTYIKSNAQLRSTIGSVRLAKKRKYSFRYKIYRRQFSQFCFG